MVYVVINRERRFKRVGVSKEIIFLLRKNRTVCRECTDFRVGRVWKLQ